MPQISYGGTNALPNTRGVGVADRYPFNASNIIWNYSANLSKIAGSHNLKAGVFWEKTARPAPRAATFNGNYNFDGNANNPFDTNLGFANALLGSINSYTESTAKPFAEGRFNQVELFVQDNWRVKPNFTIDVGARFYYIGPTFVAGQEVAYFDPNAWQASRAPLLFQPVCPGGAATCAGSVRQARNPLTGEILNNTYIDKLVPNSGDFYNGMVVADETVYGGKGLLPAPRLGFAWDITGDGKTSVRGGWGIFYDRYSGRHHPVARRAAAAHGHPHDQLHDDSAAAELAADSEPARGHRVRRVQGADRLQLEHRRAAGAAVESHRRRRLCRQRRPASAGHPGDQQRALRHAAAAAERRPDQRRRAGRASTTCGPIVGSAASTSRSGRATTTTTPSRWR